LGIAAFASVLPSQMFSRYATKLPSPYLGARNFMPEDLGGSGYRDSLFEQTINGRCESKTVDLKRPAVRTFGRCHVRFHAKPSIYLFGDSSAGIIKKEFSRVSQSSRISLSIHAVDGCFVPELNVQAGCGSGLRSYLYNVSEKWKPGDIIVASYNWMGWGAAADVRHRRWLPWSRSWSACLRVPLFLSWGPTLSGRYMSRSAVSAISATFQGLASRVQRLWPVSPGFLLRRFGPCDKIWHCQFIMST